MTPPKLKRWRLVRLLQQVTACLCISTVFAVLHLQEILAPTLKVVMFFWRNSEQMERDTTLQKNDAEKLEFEAWPDFRDFRICRMIIRSEGSSYASRPVEAMIWINEVQTAKSIADLKMSHTISGVQKQTNCEDLDSETASDLKKITDGDSESRVSQSRRSCRCDGMLLFFANQTRHTSRKLPCQA